MSCFPRCGEGKKNRGRGKRGGERGCPQGTHPGTNAGGAHRRCFGKAEKKKKEERKRKKRALAYHLAKTTLGKEKKGLSNLSSWLKRKGGKKGMPSGQATSKRGGSPSNLRREKEHTRGPEIGKGKEKRGEPAQDFCEAIQRHFHYSLERAHGTLRREGKNVFSKYPESKAIRR